MKNRYLTLTRSKGTDEYYTPQSAVSLIAPYISPDKTIWCPFDTEKSNFVSVFRAREYGYPFSYRRRQRLSHVRTGKIRRYRI